MATVRILADTVQGILDELTTLKRNISESYAQVTTSDRKQLKQSQEVRDLTEQSEMYDHLFEEEEAKIQALGGKTRAETLQEFVLLFFFVAYGVFSISLALFALAKQGTTAAAKIIFLMLFSGLLIAGIIMRYG